MGWELRDEQVDEDVYYMTLGYLNIPDFFFDIAHHNTVMLHMKLVFK